MWIIVWRDKSEERPVYRHWNGMYYADVAAATQEIRALRRDVKWGEFQLLQMTVWIVGE